MNAGKAKALRLSVSMAPAFRKHTRWARGYLRSSALIGGFTAVCLTASTAASISLQDDLGRMVELKAPAKRIVALAPFLTELVFSAGAGARLVGVSAYSDFPPEARALPQVGSAAGPEVEALAGLRPDLVLAWQDGIRRDEVERIASLGMAVFVARARRLDDPARILEAIGALTGHDASAAATRYRAALERLRAAHSGRPAVRTFVEVWHRPLTTIAGTHWINEALGVCGGENVFGDLSAVAPVVSWEELYRRDPRLVLGAGEHRGEPAFRANWNERATLGAVKAGRLAYVDADLLQRPTLRLADGVARLCGALESAR